MKAFRYHAPLDGRVDTVDDPGAGNGDVVLRPLVSGLCSTDIHAFTTGAIFRPETTPITMGHEVVAEVVEVGAAVAVGDGYTDAGAGPLVAGDRVLVEPLLPCGRCRNCVRGAVNACIDWSHLGFYRPGCWADFVAVPASRVVRAPESDPRVAVFTEPLACALNFVDKSGVGPGESALVLGGGPAGVLTVQALKAAGVDPVILSEPLATRRQLALQLGADVVVDPVTEDVATVVREHTAGVGADVVIDVTGVATSAAQALDVATPGSTVVLASVCGREQRTIDPDVVVLKELSVRGALASRWHFARALRLLATGRVDVEPLISSERPWQEAAHAMADLAERPEMCKVLLTHV